MILMSNGIEYPYRNLDQNSRIMCYKKFVTLQLKVCESSVGWRQYGFFDEQFNERVTIVFEMSDDDLTVIPSHNFDCERDLAI